MAGRIPQHFIDELVARTDIIEVIGSRVQLKRAGPRVQGLLPVPRREDAVVLGEPGQAVLSLLRLRRARHGARLRDGIRPPRLRRGGRGARGAPRSRGPARRRRAAPRPNEDLYVALERAALFFRQSLSGEPRAREYLAGRGLTSESLGTLRHRLRAVGLGRALLDRYGTTQEERQTLCARGPRRSSAPTAERALRPLPRPRHVPDPRRRAAAISASAAACSTRASRST